jgi:hypothetical protein
MTDTFRALCAELVEQLQRAINDHGLSLEGKDALMHRARAALAEGAGVGVTDEELAAAALKALESHRYATELPYFLSPDSSEYEPFMLTFRAILARYGTTHPRPIPVAEWNEDDGDVLWWRLPVKESPYVGSPLWDDWVPGYYTHFTRLQVPAAAIPLPSQQENKND